MPTFSCREAMRRKRETLCKHMYIIYSLGMFIHLNRIEKNKITSLHRQQRLRRVETNFLKTRHVNNGLETHSKHKQMCAKVISTRTEPKFMAFDYSPLNPIFLPFYCSPHPRTTLHVHDMLPSVATSASLPFSRILKVFTYTHARVHCADCRE